MRIFVKILSLTTLTLSAATVGSIFYEGMALEWYDHVVYLINATDVAFLLATIVGLIYYRQWKPVFLGHVISLGIIGVGAIVSIIYGHEIPDMLFTLWEFYILFAYGFIVAKGLWNLPTVLQKGRTSST